MTQATDPIVQRADTKEVRQQLKDKHVCPFCGVIRADHAQPCPRCTMDDTANTRGATRQRIGPWFVMQARNPSAPGMKFATLQSMVKKGHVTPRSIVRGPTTHQLWTFAAKVRGLSRELGLCYHCGEAVEAVAPTCSKCSRSQEPPADPDVLLEPQGATPEMHVGPAASSETGMDGGTSLDLQVDDIPGLSMKPPRPAAPSNTLPALNSSRPGTPLDRSKAEEAILSARELAAAFQLDFKPKQPAKSATRVPVTPAPAGKPAKIKPSADSESKPGLFKLIAAFLLIAAVVVGILAVIRPDMRDNAVVWLNTKWGAIKQNLDAPATPLKPVAPAPVVAKPTVEQPKVEPKIEAKTEPKTQPKIDPRPVRPPAPTPRPPSPAPVVVAPKPDPIPPVAVVEPKVVPIPLPASSEPVRVVEDPVDTGTADANLSIDQATTLAQQLRKQAIDVEGNDWRKAVQLYQRIERLPREAWPADLQLRLDRARSKVK